MSDISVTLGLDDSGYTSKLKAAESQAKSFSSSSTSAFNGIQSSVNATSSAVQGLNSKFETLTKVIVGVGIADFAKSLLESANTLKDLANSLDVTVASMMEMGLAASQAGGNLEKVAGMMQKMEIAAGQAAEGNVKMRVAFQDLGLSMSDMQKLSPDEAFKRIVASLANIQSPAERSAKAMDIFGKTFKGISFGDLNEKLKETAGTMTAQAEAQKTLADFSERLKTSFTLLQYAFADILKPLVDLIPAAGSMKDQMSQAEVVAKGLAAAFALFGAAATVNALGAIGNAAKGLLGLFAADTAAVSLNTVALELNREQYKFRAAAMGVLGTATKNAIAAEQALNIALAAGTATKAELIALENALFAARERLAVATTVATKTQQAYATASAEVAIASGAATAGATGAAIGIGATGTAAAVATGPMYAFGLALGRIVAFVAPIVLLVAAIELVNFALEKAFGQGPIDYFADKLETFVRDTFPTLHGLIEKTGDLLGMAQSPQAKKVEEQKETAGASQAAADAKKRAELESLARQKEESEKAKLISDRIKDVTVQYTAQAEAIAKTTEQMNWSNTRALERIQLQTDIVSLSKADQAASLAAFDASTKYHNEIIKIDEAILAMQAKRKENPKEFAMEGGEKVLAAYEAQKRALQDITSQVKELTKAEVERKDAAEMTTYFIEMQKKATETKLQIEYDLADLTATENEKKLSAINRQIDAEVKLAIAKRQSQLGEGTQISAAEAASIEARVRKSYEGIADATGRVIAKSREFSTGWSKAAKQYIEDAGNAAKTGEALFTKAFQGMEDAIVGFVKTGKFEWKSFVTSMLEELLRSQIKNLFANMISGVSGSLGGLAGAFGTAGVNNQTAGMTGGGASSGGGILDSIAGLFGSNSNGTKGTPVFVTNMPGGAMGGFGGAVAGGAGTGGLGGIWDSITGLFSPTPNLGQYPGISGGGASQPGDMYDIFGGLMSAAPSITVPDTSDDGWFSGGIFSGIADTFSSIGDSIGSLFDGWFADGGSIGAGKFGVVGENGPELVRGPGTVNPMRGGSGSSGVTNVTYNINAVDALSFKQMIAADPSFLWAVTQQGAKGMRA